MIDPCIRRIRALPPSHSLLAGLIAALSGVSAANASPPQAARNAFGQGVLAPARIVQPAGSPGQAALSMASVSSCADDGPGTLRAAVATHAAMIDLTGLACSKITLTTGAIRVDAEVPSITISGPTSHLLTIDANHDSRILLHYGNGTLTLDHLRLINGSISPDIQYNGAARYGGSVFSSGSVVLQHASISNCLVAIGNAAVTVGGAVYAHGDLTLNDSVLSGNVAQGLSVMGGGAFFNGKLDMYRSAIRDNVAIATAGTAVAGGAYAGGTAQLYASTISGNQAGYEGGLVVTSNATIENSTISGNSASVAGAMSVNGLLVLDNSTVALNTNSSNFFGSVYVKGGIVAHSSIVANNCYTGGVHCDIQCKSCTISGSKNLILGANVALPPDTILIDPTLAPLADNGGPTQTHALLPGSPAHETGSNIHNFPFDQRGQQRQSGTAPDIGAFEEATDFIFANGFD